MADTTLRQVLREAQRAGRLGSPSDSAVGLLRRVAQACQDDDHDAEFAWATLGWLRSPPCPQTGLRTSRTAVGDDEASDADRRELGDFLARLAELL